MCLFLFLLTCLQSILHANFNEHPQVEAVSSETILYVEPKDVTITRNGIYCDFDGQRIPVSRVQMDSNGLFVCLNNNDNEVKYIHYICPGCGRRYAWYENCNTPGCPYNRSKPKP